MAVDILFKRMVNPTATKRLIDHIVSEICLKVQPADSNTPILRIYDSSHLNQFKELDLIGDYSIEFLLVVLELIQTQERTNYPHGTGHFSVYKKIQDGADIFSVISAAAWPGR